MNKDIITVGDRESADINLIWFHGYGANNWGFEPFIKLLNLNLDGRLFVVMPNAPLDDGKRSWYPLPKEHDGGVIEDDEGIIHSKEQIKSSLVSYIDSNKKTYLGGFSQGAALSLSMGINADIDCDAIIAISGYIPSSTSLKIKNKSADIYLAHGNKDTTISIETHDKSMAFLKGKGINPYEFVDDCGHTISKAMIGNLTDWVYKKL
jgi:predicted esterase